MPAFSNESAFSYSPVMPLPTAAYRVAILTLGGAPTIRPRFLKWTVATPCEPLDGEAGSGMIEDFAMSRRCELTAKGPQVGHKVSHSNHKSKRRFLPNLCNVTLISETLGRSVRLRISTSAIKSVDHNGGLDAFLLKANAAVLSPKAVDLKRQIEKKRLAAAS